MKTLARIRSWVRRKLIKRSFLLGAILGLACHAAPPEYQDACKTVAKAVSLQCEV